MFLPSDLRQAASPLHAHVLVDPVKLTLCSHGSVMSDAALISKGGWEPSLEVLTEAELAQGLLSWSTHCVRLGPLG